MIYLVYYQEKTLFYHEIEPQSIEYNGTFVCEGSLLDVSPESSNTRSYNGNLPSSDVTQKERIENIYGIALQYYSCLLYTSPSPRDTR